jgi:hypothetical protein
VSAFPLELRPGHGTGPKSAIGLSKKDWLSGANGAVLSSNPGREERSEILPRRLYRRDGASVVRPSDAALHRTEDLNVEVYEEFIN